MLPIFLAPMAFLFLYIWLRNVAQPGWRLRRKLPHPYQPFWLFRLFYEPNGFDLERWSEVVPHDGIVRYFGLLNKERIFAASPQATKDLLGSGTYKFVKPQLQFDLSVNVAARGLVLLEGQEHKDVKRCLVPAFNWTKISQVHPIAWENTRDAVARIAGNIVDGRVQVLKVIQAVTLETMGKWAFSTDLGALQEPQSRFAKLYTGLFRATRHGEKALTLASIIGPRLMMALPFRAPKTMAYVASYVRNTIDTIVTERELEHKKVGMKEKKEQGDFLDTLIASGELSHEHVVDESVHFLVAAAEMPAIMVSWVIHLISRHPLVQDRLRSELQQYLSNNVEMPNQLDKLPYLNAVLDESLRIHHLDTVLWRQAAEMTSLAGIPIHAGVQTVWSPWVLNRDQEHWGPDADAFRPERWLENTGQRFSGLFSNINFGIGPRRCIGEQYGRAVARCMVAGFVSGLQLSPVDTPASTNEGLEIGISPPISFFKILDGWELRAQKI
jgi:cytochrome P450